MKQCTREFFKELELYEDIHASAGHKKALITSINAFLQKNTEENAYKVYEVFFKAYWTGIQQQDNPFLALLNTLKKFEENAGRLLDKQRDHYVHSVNVFILGLAIYVNNLRFKEYFDSYVTTKTGYKDYYTTRHEEFFYRWGLASLFHDIAYPLEITLRQAARYFDLVWSYPKQPRIKNKPFIEFPNFDEFIALPCLKPTRRFNQEFYQKYPHLRNFNHCDGIELLSYCLSKNLSLTQKQASQALHRYADNMKKYGVIDHGFYGAVIMLKWYHFLLKTTKWNPAYFFYPILDSSSAILLHNFYKRIMMKKPLNLRSLCPSRHPIAFLLMLCDELQEWNRKLYGEFPTRVIDVNKIKLSFGSDSLKLAYMCSPVIKKEIFKRPAVAHRKIFKNGITIIGGK